MVLTENEAERITRYLDMRTVIPEHADLVFVFGTRHPEPAHMAANLVKCGVGHRVVLTGGSNRLTGIVEATTHLEILLASGVPRECIILESASANTSENVRFALPGIQQQIHLEMIASVAVVTKWYHCRRAMMTLKRHLPAGIRYHAVTCEPEGIRRSDWWRSERGRQPILKEMDRIPRYLAAGDIAEIREENGVYT
ncbi:MAG: YdcF family protein [Anaerolineales bacterium]|nr:MAG: YdcF family protein [Anaerolineales bacterium]